MRAIRGGSPGNGDERRRGILGGAKERSIKAIQEKRVAREERERRERDRMRGNGQRKHSGVVRGDCTWKREMRARGMEETRENESVGRGRTGREKGLGMIEIVTSTLAGREREDDFRSEPDREGERERTRWGGWKRDDEGRKREIERGSEERNRQWIRVSYRGMKGNNLREASGAREYLALSYLPEDVDDINVDDDDDNVDEDEEWCWATIDDALVTTRSESRV